MTLCALAFYSRNSCVSYYLWKLLRLLFPHWHNNDVEKGEGGGGAWLVEKSFSLWLFASIEELQSRNAFSCAAQKNGCHLQLDIFKIEICCLFGRVSHGGSQCVVCVRNWHFTHLIYELVNTIKIQNLLDCFMSSRYLCTSFSFHSIQERETKRNGGKKIRMKQWEKGMGCHFICFSVLCVYFAPAASAVKVQKEDLVWFWVSFLFFWCCLSTKRLRERNNKSINKISKL